MADDFFSTLVGSKTRARLLRIFVFNQSESFTSAEAAKRAGISPQATQHEIRALERMRVIRKSRGLPAPKKAWKLSKAKQKARNTKKENTWTLNAEFPHVRALTMFVHEVSPVRYARVVDALKRAGKVAVVIVSGALMGDESRPADLIIAGDNLSDARLEAAMRVLEPQFGREIRYAAFSISEFKYRMTTQDRLIRETIDYPHLVLLDKTRMLQ